MEYRSEHDSMGEVMVPADKMWGAQTERSRNNFKIGNDGMPQEIISALVMIKKAAALANRKLDPGRMSEEKCSAICFAADEILSGKYDDSFPLSVWQTGSGTQSNMNVNEVISHIAEKEKKAALHPNDDVNMSQSSNDTFPAAMHVAAVLAIEGKLLPAAKELISTFERLEEENKGIIKSGRTHLQDAVPIEFSAEISGWRSSVQKDCEFIENSLDALRKTALGATAVGSGLNAPEGFDIEVSKELSKIAGTEFLPSENKYHSLTSKDELVFAHGAVKALACDMMKIANDVRWLASGPRLGLGEISIPANEPGSSIMPGKVNPTQCEQVTMVAVQVMAADSAIAIAASQGNFELNVFMPVCIYNFLHSVNLLTDSISSFNRNCASGIKADRKKMRENYDNSLMRVTELSPLIGYEKAAEAVQYADRNGISLKEALEELGISTEGSDGE